MPVESVALFDKLWVDLCFNFGLILLLSVCVPTALLMLCCCQAALGQLLARSKRERRSRDLRRPNREPAERRFTTSL
jgi:hypothetical protein